MFGGREAETAELNNFISSPRGSYFFIEALAGFGKTALLANWTRSLTRSGERVAYHFISQVEGSDTAGEDFTFRSLCQQLAAFHGLQGPLPASPGELRTLYSLLLQYPPSSGKLIVVLDALDEALGWKPLADLFPRSLPQGIFVVFSARKTAGQDWLGAVGLGSHDVKVMELVGLGTVETASLLRAAGESTRAWADDPKSLQAIRDISGGDPFYVRYLVEDILTGRIASAGQLTKQPSGLKTYLDQWWVEVTSVGGDEQAVYELLGYVLVSRGPVTRDDLVQISDSDALNGVSVDRVVKKLSRFLLGTEVEGYRFCHSRFRDYIAKERVKGSEQKMFDERLRSYCARWREHWSTYALAYGPDYLEEAGSVQDLRAMILDAGRDFRFLATRLNVKGISRLLADLDLVADNETLRHLKEALRLSATTLAADPDQLAGHLLGRLLGDIDAGVQGALRSIATARSGDTWLCPITGSLVAPGGPLIRTLTGPHSWLSKVAVSKDGQVAVAASNMTMFDSVAWIEVWDLRAEKINREFAVKVEITGIALTSDARLLLGSWNASGNRGIDFARGGLLSEITNPEESAQPEYGVKVWDLSSGELLRDLQGHGDRVTAIAVTPDDRMAVSASSDRSLIVWEIASGKVLRTLEGHAGPVNDVAISPDGQFAVSVGGKGDPTLRVWDLANGTQVRVIGGGGVEEGGELAAVAVSPDGRIAVVASSDRTLMAWNLHSGEALHKLVGHTDPIHGVAITPDSRFALSASGERVYSEDNSIRVWDLVTGACVDRLLGHGHQVSAVAVVPGSQTALSVSFDETMRIWDLARRRAMAPERHEDDVNALAVTPDGRLVVSASTDRTLKVWEAQTGALLFTLRGHTSSVENLVLTSDGKYAVSSSGNYSSGARSQVCIWDLATAQLIKSWDGGDYIRALAVSPDDRWVITAGNGSNLNVVDLTGKENPRKFSGHSGWVYCLAVTPDSRRIISGSNEVRVWDLVTGEGKVLAGSTGDTTDVALTPDGLFAISSSSDGTLRVWDLTIGKEKKVLTGHPTIVNSVDISPSGGFAVTSSGDGLIMLWSTSTWESLATFRSHTAAVYDIAMPRDTALVASASVDESLKVWDCDDRLLKATFKGEGGFNACACTPDGAIFIGGDRSGGVHFLRLEQPPEDQARPQLSRSGRT